MSMLVDTAVRTSIVLAAALLATAALTRRSAALRHWVLTVGVACAAAMPLFQSAFPAWHVSLATFAPAAPATQRQSEVTSSLRIRTGAAQPVPARGDAAPLNRSRGSSRLPVAIVSVWLVGALLSVSRLAVGLRRLSRLASRAQALKAGRLAAIADDLAGGMGLRRPVTLLHASDSPTPVTWGALAPAIVLPAGAPAWSDDRARIVLRHELAHVARGDWLPQVLAEALGAVYWFNPVVYIASRRLRAEAERACDDEVLNAGVAPADYATHLVEIAREAASRRMGSALAMARPSSLEGRINAMLNMNISRRPLKRIVRTAILLAFTALAVPIALAQGRFWSFSGTVLDQTNRVVADSRLVLTNGSTGATYEVRTDQRGRFAFVALPSGEYQLAVEHAGFAKWVDAIAIGSEDVDRTIRLRIGRVQETVRVDGGAAEPAQLERTPEESRLRGEAIRRRAADKCGAGAATDEAGGQILPPIKLVHVRPRYPDALKASKIGGEVILDALIDTDGTVRDVTAVSSPHPGLEQAAVEAVRGWEFSPTYLNCTPIQVPMRVAVTFVAPLR
jgi:TonB family protein